MGRFTDQERKLLKSNKYVKKVTESNIHFTVQFKKYAIKQYNNGVLPAEIFAEAGVDVEKFDRGYARKSISRWQNIIEKNGVKSLGSERRGKGSTGRPKKVKKFKSEKEELAYLRAENEFLKKLHALSERSPKKKSSR